MRETYVHDREVEQPKMAEPQLERTHAEEPEAVGGLLTYAAVRRRVFERMVAGTLVHAGVAGRNA